jgi:hypothetical protein
MKLHETALLLAVLFVVLPDQCRGATLFEDAVKSLEGLSKQERLVRVRREAQKEGRLVWMSGKDLARRVVPSLAQVMASETECIGFDPNETITA